MTFPYFHVQFAIYTEIHDTKQTGEINLYFGHFCNYGLLLGQIFIYSVYIHPVHHVYCIVKPKTLHTQKTKKRKQNTRCSNNS